MASDQGPGKAAKTRKHASSSRTPYARPKPSAAPGAASTPAPHPSETPGTDGKSSLLGSVFSAATTPLRAAAHFMNRVRCSLPFCIFLFFSAHLYTNLVSYQFHRYINHLQVPILGGYFVPGSAAATPLIEDHSGE